MLPSMVTWGKRQMKKTFFADAAEADRLRKYADQMDLIGKTAVAAIWRDLADRVEAGAAPPVKGRARIWFDARNAHGGAQSSVALRAKP
jgi:hypothetical protein